MPLFNASISVTFPDITADSATDVSQELSTTAVEISAPNVNKKGVSIFNNTSADIFLGIDNSVSNISYKAKVQPGGYYEEPFRYTGSLWAVLSSGTGTPQIFEYI